MPVSAQMPSREVTLVAATTAVEILWQRPHTEGKNTGNHPQTMTIQKIMIDIFTTMRTSNLIGSPCYSSVIGHSNSTSDWLLNCRVLSFPMLGFTLYLKSRHQRYLKNENIFEISIKTIILAIPKICKTGVFRIFTTTLHTIRINK
jgi:hypothetical protein